MRCVWAPSTGFIIPDSRQPVYGEKEVGYVEHRFEPDGGHSCSFVRVAGLQRLDIADFAAAFGKGRQSPHPWLHRARVAEGGTPRCKCRG
jgi:hypothetical protein